MRREVRAGNTDTIESTWSKASSMDVKETIAEASQQLGISLKEKQFEAIFTFCCGHDVSIVSLPTASKIW